MVQHPKTNVQHHSTRRRETCKIPSFPDQTTEIRNGKRGTRRERGKPKAGTTVWCEAEAPSATRDETRRPFPPLPRLQVPLERLGRKREVAVAAGSRAARPPNLRSHTAGARGAPVNVRPRWGPSPTGCPSVPQANRIPERGRRGHDSAGRTRPASPGATARLSPAEQRGPTPAGRPRNRAQEPDPPRARPCRPAPAPPRTRRPRAPRRAPGRSRRPQGPGTPRREERSPRSARGAQRAPEPRRPANLVHSPRPRAARPRRSPQACGGRPRPGPRRAPRLPDAAGS